MPFPVPVDRSILTTMQPHRGFFMPVSGRMRPGRAFFIPKIARHGVKLHSQGGCEKTKAASLQGQVDDLTKQLNTAKDGLKAFEGVDVADLKGQITKLQGQLTDQADSFAFDAALDGAIRDARGRDVKAIRGMLDVAALKASKDRTSDIKTALDALVKGKAWAFDAAPGGYPNVKDGGEAAARGKGGMVDGVEAAFASMNPNLKV